MPFHDAYLRTTPFELAFPDGSPQLGRMADIAEEAASRGADTGDLGAFAMMGAVNGALRELGGPEATADAIIQYAALLFHAFHLHGTCGVTYLVEAPVCRFLVEGPVRGGAPSPPAPSGYVQLPRNLFWIHADSSAPAEAVDGLFWTASEGRLHVLLVSGVLEGRPGMGVVPLPEAPLDEAAAWVGSPMRAAGDDFATTLPGGELEGLYSFTTAGEVLKLLARFFAYVAAVPDAVTEEAPPGGERTPAPSSLAYLRARLSSTPGEARG